MKNHVAVMVEDRWIDVDGETVEFENGFRLAADHRKRLWALHWDSGKGSIELENPPEHLYFGASQYGRYVAPYVRQWEAEKARQKAEEEAEWNRPENVEARARERRNELLAETDYMLMPDYPLTDVQREAWTAYRQSLRDVSRQEGWPLNIVWPEMPSV